MCQGERDLFAKGEGRFKNGSSLPSPSHLSIKSLPIVILLFEPGECLEALQAIVELTKRL
jgi:hypothetical protein